MSIQLSASDTIKLYEDIWSIMDQHAAKGDPKDLLLSELYVSLTHNPKGRMSRGVPMPPVRKPYKCKRRWKFSGDRFHTGKIYFHKWLESKGFPIHYDGAIRQTIYRVKNIPEGA